MHWALALALTGCIGERTELALVGPARVSVDELGPVAAPAVVDDEGAPVEPISWAAEPDAVARVESGQVVAVGPGEAVVTGEHEGASISWTLVVEPAVMLRVVEPPARIAPGESAVLAVEGRIGDQVVDPGPLTWRSADDSILVVREGEVRGIAPGLGYVTVASARSEAMVEILVEAR